MSDINYHDEIDKVVASTGDYDTFQIFVKKHRGEVRNLDIGWNTIVQFTDNEPNVTAASQILSLLKSQTLAKANTALTFTVVFKNGRANQLQIQNSKKV